MLHEGFEISSWFMVMRISSIPEVKAVIDDFGLAEEDETRKNLTCFPRCGMQFAHTLC